MWHVLLQLLTGADNKTHDLRSWLALVSCLTGFGLQIYVVGWKGQIFSIQDFGVGVGALLAGYGAALKLGGDNTIESDLRIEKELRKNDTDRIHAKGE